MKLATHQIWNMDDTIVMS